ncbi:hypothetical protein MN0502_15120 [Arthrobacter sp. MN05-02]|nr:hypothetical protein MN0502_15120 [Arthrobacter sp. MN05-02]
MAVLGADIAWQCLAFGRLHEILVLIEPVPMGVGTRLLDVPGGTDVRRSLGEYGHEMKLWLDVVPRSLRPPVLSDRRALPTMDR